MTPTLTPREFEVLTRLAEGDPYLQIGQRLFMSVGTVRRHVVHIHQKLGVHNSRGAVMAAIQCGLLDPYVHEGTL